MDMSDMTKAQLLAYASDNADTYPAFATLDSKLGAAKLRERMQEIVSAAEAEAVSDAPATEEVATEPTEDVVEAPVAEAEPAEEAAPEAPAEVAPESDVHSVRAYLRAQFGGATR